MNFGCLSVCIVVKVIFSCSALHIHECDRYGRLWWDESKQPPVVCVNFSHPSNLVVTWDMTYINGSVRHLGKCSRDLCETKDSDVVLTKINDTCELRLLRNHRQFAGSKVRCSGIFPSQQANCTLHVEYPAQLADCFLWSNGLEGGSVSGSCRVPKVYSSKGSYHCRWFQWINNTEHPKVIQVGNISLSEFTDCSGQQFFRGFCSMSISSLVLDGSVHYKVDFYPGSGYTAVDNIYVAPSLTPLIVDSSENRLTDCITSTVPFKTYDHRDEKGQDSSAGPSGIVKAVIGGVAGAIILILFLVLAVMIFNKRIRVLSYTKSESTFRSYISASTTRENALNDKPLYGGALDTKEISYKLEDIVMIENVTYDSVAMNRRL